MKAKERIAERISVTVLPYADKIHQLPPTPSSMLDNGSESERLLRVSINIKEFEIIYEYGFFNTPCAKLDFAHV